MSAEGRNFTRAATALDEFDDTHPWLVQWFDENPHNPDCSADACYCYAWQSHRNLAVTVHRMTNPERIPARMIELTELALRYGLDVVSLGFETIGYDFPAPTGWQLGLIRRDNQTLCELGVSPLPDVTLDQVLNVSVGVGGEPTAYVAQGNSDDPDLDADQIAEWIVREDEYIPNPSVEEDQTRLAADSKLMIDAVNNGWSAKRTLRQDLRLLSNRLSGTSQPLPGSYQFNALNYFYNIPGHESHYGTGADVSFEMVCGRPDVLKDDWSYALNGTKQITLDDLFGMVRTQAPWFTPVAYFYEDAGDDGEWVL